MRLIQRWPLRSDGHLRHNNLCPISLKSTRSWFCILSFKNIYLLFWWKKINSSFFNSLPIYDNYVVNIPHPDLSSKGNLDSLQNIPITRQSQLKYSNPLKKSNYASSKNSSYEEGYLVSLLGHAKCVDVYFNYHMLSSVIFSSLRMVIESSQYDRTE